ncbi:MAG: 30S ribosomal protein S8 [Coxiellaceae bacterium]|nr:30S ribosomal protein S8 [Coxiellaceae bacterium]
MSLQDPISDMLTRIRNAQAVSKKAVEMPLSRIKMAIAAVLKDEGYVTGFGEVEGAALPTMRIELKYFDGKPVIEKLQRESKPSYRKYKGKDELPKVNNGLGVAVISTSAGVMSDKAARRAGKGGEVLLYVS